MTRSKKKRSAVSTKKNTLCNVAPHEAAKEKEKQRVLKILLEAFTSVSVEDASSAYEEANGDADKAAEILANVVAQEDQSSSCSSSGVINNVCSSSSSNGSDLGGDVNDFLLQDGFRPKGKVKSTKVIASAGSVATLLEKDYVRSVVKKSSAKLKGSRDGNWSTEEAEQFLCSMLGDESELSLAVVSDVLCQCGFNVEKALDVLIELSHSSNDQACDFSEYTVNEGAQYFPESADSLTDKTSDLASSSSEVENRDSQWFWGNMSRNPYNIPNPSESGNPAKSGKLESELPQKVLESLFNMPTPSTAEHEPNTMNWRNVVKKMASLSQRLEPTKGEGPHPNCAKGDEYHVLRASGQQHWQSMKSYYQKAATAFSKGEREYAAYLSEQGRIQRNMARRADEKASKDIFAVRNQHIENMITIDLHGQHIKQAMKLLKLHLLFGAYARCENLLPIFEFFGCFMLKAFADVSGLISDFFFSFLIFFLYYGLGHFPAVRSLRVITGCGSAGKPKLKNSVIGLLQREGISWSEENRGTLLIRLDGQTNFSFLDSGSDSD